MTRGLKFLVTIRWNDHDQKWFMSSSVSGRFLYEFFDCENMHRLFKGIDTNRPTNYELTIQRKEGSDYE